MGRILPIVLPIVLPIELPIAYCLLPITYMYVYTYIWPIGQTGAWLGGPRVLRRTGLVWGAKGPGPDRLGLGGQGSWAGQAWFLILTRTIIFRRFIFKKYHIKSDAHLIYDCIFTVFLNLSPNRFCLNPEPHELVWKSVWSILHRNFVSKFHIVFKKIKIWNPISRSFRSHPRPNKIGFGAWGRFCLFLKSNILPICLPYGKCSTNSLRYSV